MLPLYRKEFPASKADLAQALEEAAHRIIPKSDQIVDLRARVFPYIDEIAINCDDTHFDSPPPAPAALVGETKAAFDVATINLSARNISVTGVPVNLRAEAREVVLHKGEDESGNAVLVLHSLREGQICFSAGLLDLESAIQKIAREKARGVTIEKVRLAMRARGPRSLNADVHVQARKLLLRAKIDISGQIDIDEGAALRLLNLKCKSDGAIGAIACNLLDPVFARLNDRTFPLASFLPEQIQIRDIRVAVADTVELTIDFGRPE